MALHEAQIGLFKRCLAVRLPLATAGHRPTMGVWGAIYDGDAAKVEALLAAGAEGAPASRVKLLHDAANYGRCAGVVEALLKHGVDPNAADDEGLTALHYAAKSDPDYGGRKRPVEVARVLLDRGADVNAAAADGQTALHYAAKERGQLELARLLLDRGADVNAAAADGRTPLHLASENADATRLLLDRGANVNAAAADGQTALHGAWFCVEVARALLDRGADANAVAADGSTPLLCAVESGCGDAARLLLERGANLDAVTADGHTVLEYAMANGVAEIVQPLMDRGVDVDAAAAANGTTALHEAAARGHVKLARLLLDRGADVNAVAANGQTALHCAVLRDQYLAAELLLERGANANAVAPESGVAGLGSCPPLHVAVQCNRPSFIGLLAEHGADLGATAEWHGIAGFTALHVAAFGGVEHWLAERTVRKLLDAGAPVNAGDRFGRGPLHLAVERSPIQVVELLLARGADASAADEDGEAPLHIVCRDVLRNNAERARDLVRMLLGAGANPHAPLPDDDCTPLHLAARHAADDDGAAVVAELLRRGADARAADCDHLTPLHFACNPAGELAPAVVELLLDAGADACAAAYDGRQPLHRLAARELGEQSDPVREMTGAERIAALLERHGADLDAADDEGFTPLMLAAKSRSFTSGAVLISRGARAGPPQCGRCTDAEALRTGAQVAVIGLAGEAARLRRQQEAWEQERAALAAERAAWERERAAIEAARGSGGSGGGGGGGGGQPAAKRARSAAASALPRRQR